MNPSHDILIVGAGLAGSILADRLLRAGLDIRIVSDPSIPAASRVAAGLINPVSGKRLVLQENIEPLLQNAEIYYHDVERRFGIKLLHQKEMLRVFQSAAEREAWERRRSEPAYRDYLDDALHDGDPLVADFHDAKTVAPFGSCLQRRTGYLDTNLLLDSLHRQFRETGLLIEAPLAYSDLVLQSDRATWQGVTAGGVVFCEGWRGRHNPWFNWLPFQPVKGEILTLSCAETIPDRVINRGKWLLPTAAHQCKCGATYDRDQLNETITEAAKDELLAAMKELLPKHSSVEVTAHAAGVRPGTRDKHPFIGRHPALPQLGIFNGFGSKGSMLIPWYAERFIRHLIDAETLPEEAAIARFCG